MSWKGQTNFPYLSIAVAKLRNRFRFPNKARAGQSWKEIIASNQLGDLNRLNRAALIEITSFRGPLHRVQAGVYAGPEHCSAQILNNFRNLP